MYSESVFERRACVGVVSPNLNVAASGVESIGLNTGTGTTAGTVGDASKYNRFVAEFNIGVKGTSATWNFRIQESSDGTTWTNCVKDDGTTPLALTTKIQVANQFAELQIRADQLTKRYVRAQADDANGTTASAVGLRLYGYDKRQGPVKTTDVNSFLNTQISA